MALPPVSTRSAQLSPVAPATAVAPATGKVANTAPIDLLIFTSAEDWKDETDTLREAAVQAGARTDILFAEDLDGWSPEEKLASLRQTMGEWLGNGKIQASTIIYVSLHGKEQAPRVADQTPSSTAQSGRTAGEASSPAASHVEGRPDTGSAGATSPSMYVFTADDEDLRFPGAMLASALRHASSSDGTLQPDFRGLILWGACKARKMAEALQACGGENILLAGNKEVVDTDCENCMLEVIDLIAARKRDGLPPLTGRDYWMHLRTVSGEHIAYVQDSATEIHKVLSSGFSEPVLTSFRGRSADQPQRILEAKLAHGSPKALQAVFDKFGKERFSGFSRTEMYAFLTLDNSSDIDLLREKMAILEKNGLGFPCTPDELTEYLSSCIENSNGPMVSVLLQSQVEQLKRLLPEAIGDIAKKMTPGLIELFEENKEIAQQWFSVYREAQPPEIRRAIDRYLQNSLSDKARPHITNSLCLANRELCLMNLLRNAFELNRDLKEAESLLPFILTLRKPSPVHSYLNVLLESVMMHPHGPDRDEIHKMLTRYGIEKVDYSDFQSSFNRFNTHLRWIR